MQQRISHEELKRRLSYNKKTGWFIWKDVHSKKVSAGDRAGYGHRSYRFIQMKDEVYAEHRLAWFYVTGKWPIRFIDHKNLNRSDNRWENLREVDDSANQHNTSVRLKNKLGALGVVEHSGKYLARISIRGERYRLGLFDTPEEAARVYEEARAEAYGPLVHTKEDIEKAIRKRVADLRYKLGIVPKPKLTYLQRFHNSYKKRGPDECWLWTGRMWEQTDYGLFKAKELNNRAMAASRASWIIHNGPIIEPKLVVRHKCDNPRCINPAHLVIGTYKQNMKDCVERGRINRGEDRPQSKLTEKAVIEMRRLRQKGASWEYLMTKYGVFERMCQNGHSWDFLVIRY